MILIEICECGRSTKFAKPSVCFILVVLVHLESPKMYTGPKIVRVLKRLGNADLDQWFSTWESRPAEGLWSIFGRDASRGFMYTAVLHLFYSSFRWGSLV